jgi:AAA+ ATPase superfamily predicted ATPase
MKKIFENAHEPLFGRADFKLHLQPFHGSTLKEILHDYGAYSSCNLLDFFILTGGVAKYIELFINAQAFDRISMINEIVNPHGLFLDEGRNRLIEEFGKEYGVYFSILSLIANSKTSKGEIESILEKNISGYLYRLENDYNIIKSIKPINAKPNSKVQKYEIVDNFLSFWFRFIFKYQSLIEAGSFEKLKEIILRDFDMFSGKFLEKLFVDQFKEQQQFTHIGSYWERGNQNEIDIVAIDELEKTMMICEVKLAKKRLELSVLEAKAKKLLTDYPDYTIQWKLLSLEDV